MKVIGLHVGMPRPLGGGRWRSGILKSPVAGTVHLGKTNLEGDAQADLRHHGGPDKAVCVYPEEHYRFWRGELGRDFSPADFGENFTTRGALEGDVFIGAIYRAGSATVQVTQPRQPCWKLAKRWDIKTLPLHVQETGRTGWYLRVLDEGEVHAGAELELLERVQEDWSVARANEIMHRDPTNWLAAEALARCPGLSASWRATLTRRAEKKLLEDTGKRLHG